MSITPVSRLIEQLEAHQNMPRSIEFKQSKRELKELAKKEELSEEQRGKILLILQKKGFKRNDTGLCSTQFLFAYPRVWRILHHPAEFPEESKALYSLSKAIFQKFITFLIAISPPQCHIEELVQITEAATALNVPGFEKFFKDQLQHHEALTTGNLSVVWFYHFSELAPSKKVKIPSCLEGLLPEEMTREEIVREYDLFKKMCAGGFAQEKDNLSAERLLRFFLFLLELHTPFGLEVFDLLLKSLRNGALDPNYCRRLIDAGDASFGLRERLKQDKLVIVLQGIGEVPVSLWPLLAESDFVRALMKPGMRQVDRITVDGNKANVFLIFHDLWIKQKEIKLDALSTDQLVGLLECAAFFQPRNFEETRAKICEAILKQCDYSPESMARLAVICSVMEVPELEARVNSKIS